MSPANKLRLLNLLKEQHAALALFDQFGLPIECQNYYSLLMRFNTSLRQKLGEAPLAPERPPTGKRRTF